MRIWVTRAEPGASRTAAKLRARGYAPVVAPLLDVHALPAVIELEGVGALAFTSANGVNAFASRCPERALPVFAVGGWTAKAARDAGFGEVASADGDVHALADLIAARARDLRGLVLTPGPREPAGDLAGALAAQGIPARALALYESLPATASPASVGPVDAVLVHSKKAAERLAAVFADRPGPAVFCISAAAAQPLAGRPFASLVFAARPDEESLLGMLPPP
jgi:uroporphyrinogen-III synthase